MERSQTGGRAVAAYSKDVSPRIDNGLSLPSSKSWRGKVVVTFHLHDKGLVTDVLVVEDTTSVNQGKLCEKAILDVQPYGVWPQKMREMVTKGLRIIQVSFYCD